MAILLVGGLFTATAVARLGQAEEGKNYKDFSRNIDESIESLRLGKNPTTPLSDARSQYANLIVDENFEDSPILQDLDNRINNALWHLVSQGKAAGEENIKDLRGMVSQMTGELGIDMPFAYGHASLVIFGLGLSITFLVALWCRSSIDWSGLEKAEETIDDWDKRMREAGRKKGKKKRKMELKSDEALNERKRILAATVKQAGFYLAPFFLFVVWLGYVYGDWTVIWLPFDWFSSGGFQSIGASLGSFAWFLLTYFGFAQLWRKVLIPRG